LPLRTSAPRDTLRRALFCSVIVLLTGIAFSPCLNLNFTNWDEDEYVYNNPDIAAINRHTLSAVFSSSYVGNYQPVTMLTYMLDYRLFGLHPQGYHLTNVIFHCINALLVFALLLRLSARPDIAFGTAALFALHPLRVESVAWIAELKDVQSAFFLFLSLLAYLSFLNNGRRKSYFGSLGLLLLSLLSKPSAMTQPLVLLLIDYFRNKPITGRRLLQKVPFAALGILCAVVAVIVQNKSGALAGPHATPLYERMLVPFYGAAFYCVKTLLPLHLCAFYPYPQQAGRFVVTEMLPALALVVTGILSLFLFRKRSKTAVFGVVFFLVTLLPMLQILGVGKAIVAERYTYIPCIGLFFPLVAGVVRIGAGIRTRFALTGGGIIILLVLAGITHERCKIWNDSFSLWSDVIAKCPTAAIAYNNLGNVFEGRNEYDHAIREYDTAIGLDPGFIDAYNNRGCAWGNLNEPGRAADDFSRAIRINADHPEIFFNRGNAWFSSRDYDKAIADFGRVVLLNPSFAAAYYNRAHAFTLRGDRDSAETDLRKACELGIADACRRLKSK
jgi:tetratricopeptide (TPR) repeat protein